MYKVFEDNIKKVHGFKVFGFVVFLVYMLYLFGVWEPKVFLTSVGNLTSATQPITQTATSSVGRVWSALSGTVNNSNLLDSLKNTPTWVWVLAGLAVVVVGAFVAKSYFTIPQDGPLLPAIKKFKKSEGSPAITKKSILWKKKYNDIALKMTKRGIGCGVTVEDLRTLYKYGTELSFEVVACYRAPITSNINEFVVIAQIIQLLMEDPVILKKNDGKYKAMDAAGKKKVDDQDQAEILAALKQLVTLVEEFGDYPLAVIGDNVKLINPDLKGSSADLFKDADQTSTYMDVSTLRERISPLGGFNVSNNGGKKEGDLKEEVDHHNNLANNLINNIDAVAN